MEGQLYREYSNVLERGLPFMVFGHGGRPILVFPTQNGRCHDYNEFKALASAEDTAQQRQ